MIYNVHHLRGRNFILLLHMIDRRRKFSKKYACPINASNRDSKFLRSRGKQNVVRDGKETKKSKTTANLLARATAVY